MDHKIYYRPDDMSQWNYYWIDPWQKYSVYSTKWFSSNESSTDLQMTYFAFPLLKVLCLIDNYNADMYESE